MNTDPCVFTGRYSFIEKIHIRQNNMADENVYATLYETYFMKPPTHAFVTYAR